MKKIYNKISIKNQKFWCHICDVKTVDSELPDTGTFYSVFGHEYPHKDGIGDYKQVIFAICHQCGHK